MLRPPDVEARLATPGDATPLPTGHGVLLLLNDETPLQVLAASNPRQAAASRTDQADADGSARALCNAASVWRTGSSFEADLLAIDVARTHLPSAHREMALGLLTVWLGVDPASPWAGWHLDETPGGHAVSVGPFLDRASARRWSEMLDREFELCRELAELRRAPDGTACAYKDMGLCRATCEGGEPMAAYRERLDEAAAFTAEGADARRAELEAAMQSASGEGDFERATVLRDRLEALPMIGSPADAVVGPADSFGFVGIAPSGRAHHARLLDLGLRGRRVAGDVDARQAGEDELAAVLAADGGPWQDDPAIAGVVARELVRPRRGGPAILVASGLDRSRLLAEVRRVAGVKPDGARRDA